jgi:hypothetical protein
METHQTVVMCDELPVMGKSFAVVYFKVDTYILHVNGMSEENHEHSSQDTGVSLDILSRVGQYSPLSTCSSAMLVLLACMDS